MSSQSPEQQPATVIDLELATGQKRKNRVGAANERDILCQIFLDVIRERLQVMITNDIHTLDKEEIRTKLAQQVTLPNKVLDDVARIAASQHDISITVKQISDKLNNSDNGYSKRTWAEFKATHLDEEYDELYDIAYPGGNEPFVPDAEDGDNSQTAEEKDDDKHEQEANESDNKRTIPDLSFKSLVRRDVPWDRMFQAIIHAAEATTAVVSNVAALTRATMGSIIHHKVIVSDGAVTLHKERTGFDLSAILPSGFQVRNKVAVPEGSILVAPPNHDIPALVEQTHAAHTAGRDLQLLFTNPHLQFIQSHHLGTKADSVSTDHPFWQRLVQPNCDLPCAPDGPNHTLQAAIKEYSVNLNIMWDKSSIFKKSLEYLIRVLLRLHLAPEREARHMAIIQAATENTKKAKKERKAGELISNEKDVQHLPRKVIKAKIRHEFKQMERYASKSVYPEYLEKAKKGADGCKKRFQALTERLEHITVDASKPNPLPIKDSTDNVRSKIPSRALVDGQAPLGELIDVWENKEDEEEEDEENIDAKCDKGKSIDKVKEPGQKRINALKALVKKIIRSPDIDRNAQVNDAEIQKQSHLNDLDEKEITTIKRICNILLPYTPNSDTSGLLMELPFIALANTILLAVGYKDFVREICPEVSPHEVHALALNPASIYEVLTPHHRQSPRGPFEVTPAGQEHPITSASEARKHGDNMISAFFDKAKVLNLCEKFDLEFGDRIIVRPDKTAAIYGKIKAQQVPIVSAYERRKKAKTSGGKGYDPLRTVPDAYKKLSKAEAEQQLKQTECDLKHAEVSIAELHGKCKTTSRRKDAIKQLFAQSHGDNRRNYSNILKQRVQDSRRADHGLHVAQQQLKDLRSNKYNLQKLIENYDSTKTSNPKSNSRPKTTPTNARSQCEDISTCMNLQHLDVEKQVFGATDYGHVVMAQTTALTKNDIAFHVKLYSKQKQDGTKAAEGEAKRRRSVDIEPPPTSKRLCTVKVESTESPSSQTITPRKPNIMEQRHCAYVIDQFQGSLMETPSTEDQLQQLRVKLDFELKMSKEAFTVNDLKLPKTYSLKHERIEQETHSVKHRRKREKRKKLNAPVLATEEDLRSHSFKGVIDPADIIRRQKVKIKHAPTLRAFYYSSAAMNEQRFQRLQTKRVYTAVAKEERKFVKRLGASRCGVAACKLHPIMCIGLSGMGFNTCLRGRPRRGGKKCRKEHMHSTTVVLQDEFRSSKTCIFCFSPLVMMPASKTIDGKRKRIRSHGALICTNPSCPAVVAGYTTFNRDASAAMAIGLAAVTTLFSPDHTPLPPFSRTPSIPSSSEFTLHESFQLKPSSLYGAFSASAALPRLFAGVDNVSTPTTPYML